jgi:phenylpropionate dioxygenase-like ring-hydroxylating dioxygenase large terminal subunit
MAPEDNEQLCRVGPNTVMGQFVRRFWAPVCLSADLSEPGGAPIGVRLFNQDFVLYRAPDGRLGMLDPFCIHRGSSLLLARNEESGLRCIFHGWKFAHDGALLETPNVPDDWAKSRCRAKAYRVEEAAGMVWAWLGPGEAPTRPRFLWEQVPSEQTLVVPVDLDCNWVQSLEGLVDSAHTGILHEDVLKRSSPVHAYSDFSAMQRSFAPRLEIESTDFGFYCAAIRSGAGSEPGTDQVRVTAYAAPFLCLTPPATKAFMAVPIDDTHTRFYNIWWSKTERLDAGPARDSRLEMWGVTPSILASLGMSAVNARTDSMDTRNAFPQDRAAMQAGQSFSGLPGVTAEDGAVAVAMGRIAPRANEHLVQTDLAVVQLRRMLLTQASQLANGATPPWLSGTTEAGTISPVSGNLRPGESWRNLLLPDS